MKYFILLVVMIFVSCNKPSPKEYKERINYIVTSATEEGTKVSKEFAQILRSFYYTETIPNLKEIENFKKNLNYSNRLNQIALAKLKLENNYSDMFPIVDCYISYLKECDKSDKLHYKFVELVEKDVPYDSIMSFLVDSLHPQLKRQEILQKELMEITTAFDNRYFKK